MHPPPLPLIVFVYFLLPSDLDSRYSWDVIPIYNSSAYNSSAVDSEVSVDDDNTDDDEDDDGDDDGDGDDASEYQYNGTFIGASDACNSIGSGWVFGAPRTAYENLAVREAMKVRTTLVLYFLLLRTVGRVKFRASIAVSGAAFFWCVCLCVCFPCSRVLKECARCYRGPKRFGRCNDCFNLNSK